MTNAAASYSSSVYGECHSGFEVIGVNPPSRFTDVCLGNNTWLNGNLTECKGNYHHRVDMF